MRIVCVEDNPILLLHMMSILEDLGHDVVASFQSFADLQAGLDGSPVDLAFMDIDLADGRTGPDAVQWLAGRGIPSVFVTGQQDLAAKYEHLALRSMIKPVTAPDLTRLLAELERDLPHTQAKTP